MTFIDMKAVSIAAPLKSSHYPFPRAERLREAFSWCLTDYYTKAASGMEFEACGMLVTGVTRVGKTREVKRLVSKFNQAREVMPDGRPARIVSCILSGSGTWKDLGIKTLKAFGYPLEARRTQTEIWERVVEQALRQGVIGIAFDECQHVFTDNQTYDDKVRDSFKTLLKDPRWPLMLILSGVPSLTEHVQRGVPGEQLAPLLKPVHFDPISLPRDLDEMNNLAYSYADKAGLCFDPLRSRDFFERLEHACVGRWGLVIELIIDAFLRCRLAGDTEISMKHFVDAYANASGLSPGFSPFTAPDYRRSFDREKLLKLLLKSG